MSAGSERRSARYLVWGLLLVTLGAVYLVQRAMDRRAASLGEVGEVLYIPSGKVLRYASLGHEGLIADIYWTRVVQYFGRQRLAHALRFDLLGPLLSITTELDPHLLVAYRYGAVFLAEKLPDGAGQPEAALQLLRRGIVANPDEWRMWVDLGFIYYWDLKDYASAARVFRAGSERPGAKVWVRTLAASVAAMGGEIETSRLLWSEIYRNADNEQIRHSAQEHLLALAAQEEIGRLNDLLDAYARQFGQRARSLSDLRRAGYLRVVPQDPTGVAYVVGEGGRAGLAPESKVDLRLLQ
jgi:hypothetical protein